MDCVIYFIENTINNEIYIGSTVNFNKRKSAHFRLLRKKQHHSIILQNSFNKNGNIFKMYPVVRCNKEEKIQIEQSLLDLLCPKYNISSSAKCPMLGRKHLKETINKFKNIQRPSGRDHYAYGKKRCREHVLSASTALIGSKRNNVTKKKMSETALRLNSIDRIDRSIIMRPIIDSNGVKFKSLTDAGKFHKISPQTVCDILKGRHNNTRKGVSFDYI